MKGSNISRVFFGGWWGFCILQSICSCSPCCLICIPQIYGNLCLGWPLFLVLASWSQLNSFCISADGSGERPLGKFCQVNEDMVLALEDLRSARTKTYLSISWFGSSTESFLTTLKDGVFPPNPQVFFYISLLTSITFHFIVQLCVVKVVSVLRCEFFEDIHAYTTGFRILLFT